MKSRRKLYEEGITEQINYGLIEDIERAENSMSDIYCPHEWESFSCRTDESPFQLWSDLRTDSLEYSDVTDPLQDALYETYEMERKRKKGIIPLRDCKTV